MILEKIVDKFKDSKILVVGEAILDKYIYGEVEKLSPEAPVLVVNEKRVEYNLGGAANTANNINSLGGSAYLCSICDDDFEGKVLSKLIKENNLYGKLVFERDKTIVKTRIIGYYPEHPKQPIVRIDKENIISIKKEVENMVIEYIRKAIAGSDAVIISDYDKGFLTKKIINEIRILSRKNGIDTIVDTKPMKMHFYKDFNCFTPNIMEAYSFTKVKRNSIEKDIKKIGEIMNRRLNPDYFIITCGGNGMYLFERKKLIAHIPVASKDAAVDVSGAGDTVVAALALGVAVGASPIEAARLSNYAADVVVKKRGTSTVSVDELKRVIKENEYNKRM